MSANTEKIIRIREAGARLNIKVSSYQYQNSHFTDKKKLIYKTSYHMFL